MLRVIFGIAELIKSFFDTFPDNPRLLFKHGNLIVVLIDYLPFVFVFIYFIL